MSSELVTSLYIGASVLFILSLGGLSNEEKAKRAVWFGIVGMIIAIVGTIFGPKIIYYQKILKIMFYLWNIDQNIHFGQNLAEKKKNLKFVTIND